MLRFVPFILPVWLASAAAADCPDEYDLLFYCEFPERNAAVELCRSNDMADGPDLRYSYWVDGEAELVFATDEWTGFFRQTVQGLYGTGYGTAASNGGTYYGFLVDEDLNFPNASEQGMPSPNPAVLEVYASAADLQDDTARPIARRVCDPSTIRMDNQNFGPG